MAKRMDIKFDPNHFYKWCLYYLTPHLDLGVGQFHKQLMASFRHEKIAIAAPRGHGKSTYASFFLPLYLICENPEIEITLVSATSDFAGEWLEKIKVEIEMNELIRESYGDLEGDTWSKKKIKCSNKAVLHAKGSGQQLRGTRPNVIICDDLETDEMVMSPTQRRKFDDWFWNTLLQTLPGGEGKVVVVGTILDKDSWLAEIIEHGRHMWKTRHFAAMSNSGVALWPEMFSAAKLEDIKKEMGEYGFAREYLNDPKASSEATFKVEWFNYFVKEPQGCNYFTTVDPALEIGGRNDYSAIVTCAIDESDNLYVVDIIHKQLLPKELIDFIFEVQTKYKPASIGIETMGFQKMLKYEIENQRASRRIYPNIVELKSGGRRKNLRIQALQPRMQSGKLWIKKGMNNLETELLRFPSTKVHDDIIDALAYQLDILQPATKKEVKLHPDSFLGVMEKRRGKNNEDSPVVWGSHNLRGINW